MEKNVYLKTGQKFADLIGYVSSNKYILPGNKVSAAQIRKMIDLHFRKDLKKRFKHLRNPPKGLILKLNIDKFINEKILAISDIMIFLFSLKKPSGLCAITENNEPNAKTDKFYSQIKVIHKSLLSLDEVPESEILQFYPKFKTQYSSLINNIDRVVKNLDTLNKYNEKLSESVLEAMHALRMTPGEFTDKEIRNFVRLAIKIIKIEFPNIKQYQSTTTLDQYYKQRLNHAAMYTDIGGLKRFKLTDKTKTERRIAEESELKKRGL